MTMWLSVDPMADKYPGISPYNYCAWNPVKLVDPDGRELTDFKDKNGNLVKHVEDGSNVVFQQTGEGVNLHYEYVSGEGYGRADVFEAAIQAQEELNMENPALQAEPCGRTHCNQSLQNIMRLIESIPGLNKALITGTANEMIEIMKKGTNPNYIRVSKEEALQYAASGGFAIVGYQAPKNTSGQWSRSGHVAPFTVGDLIRPQQELANIGPERYTGYITVNQAIAAKKPKSYYIYLP